MKIKKNSIVIVLLLLFITGCSEEKQADYTKDNYPVTVGGKVVLKKPERVVVLSDSLADIIIALGYESQVNGCSVNCTQEQFKKLAKTGEQKDPNIEKIKDIGAEVVLCDEDLSSENIKALSDLNIRLIMLEKAKTRIELEQLYKSVGLLFDGAVFGYNKAHEVVNKLLMDLDDITRDISNKSVSNTMCYLYDEQGTIIPKNTFTDKVMESVKAINIAGDLKNGKVDIGIITRANPNYIFCEIGVKKRITSSGEFSKLTAIKEGKVFEIDSEIMNRQGKSILEAAKLMAGDMYPELNSFKNSSAKSSNKKNETESGSVMAASEESDENMLEKDVMKIQERLDNLNYMHVKPTGKMEKTTNQAIKDFQFVNKIKITGEIDKEFLNLLFSDAAKPRPDKARERN